MTAPRLSEVQECFFRFEDEQDPFTSCFRGEPYWDSAPLEEIRGEWKLESEVG